MMSYTKVLQMDEWIIHSATQIYIVIKYFIKRGNITIIL